MLIGKFAEQDYYEDYREFYDPLTVAENMGLWTILERDTLMGVERLTEGNWNAIKERATQLAADKKEENRETEEQASQEDYYSDVRQAVEENAADRQAQL